MVDQDSGRVSRAPPYSGTVLRSPHHAAYGDFTLSVRLSQNLSAMMRLAYSAASAQTALQPRPFRRFRLFRFRSPLLPESRAPCGAVDFFSRGTEMVQFPRSRFRALCIQTRMTDSRPPGYPIRLSGDLRMCAPPPGFSQLAAAFFAS